jgi:hypothetical protein
MVIDFVAERCPLCGWFLRVVLSDGNAYITCADNNQAMAYRYRCKYEDPFPLMTKEEWRKRITLISGVKYGSAPGNSTDVVSNFINNGGDLLVRKV